MTNPESVRSRKLSEFEGRSISSNRCEVSLGNRE
jgi:hypothetical protein